MGKLFDAIKKEERELIAGYISDYAIVEGDYNCITSERQASLDYILRVWEENKAPFLFSLLGNKLSVSKEITYGKTIQDLELEVSNIKSSFDKEDEAIFPSKFYDHFYNDLCALEYDPLIDYEKRTSRKGIGFKEARCLGNLISTHTLAKNTYEGETFYIFNPKTNKPFKVQNGCKAIKAIMKIAEMYDIPYAEEFRLAHSQVLNQKFLKGNLTLSIHPLDYITMSENECSWSSCMSWSEGGAYRQGTVEMMNSACVLVAFLESSSPMWNGWNNKKWRELIIVTPEVITNIKGYPYINTSLTEMAVDFIKELADKNIGEGAYLPTRFDYVGYDVAIDENKSVSFCFDVEYMYNDFNSSLEHCSYFGANYINNLKTDITFYDLNYSGPSECMICGDIDVYLDGESYLVCDRCDIAVYCDLCGCRLTPWEADQGLIDGYRVCECCSTESFVMDVVSEEYKMIDFCREIGVYDEEFRNEEGKICANIHSGLWVSHYETPESLSRALTPEGEEPISIYKSGGMLFIKLSDLFRSVDRVFNYIIGPMDKKDYAEDLRFRTSSDLFGYRISEVEESDIVEVTEKKSYIKNVLFDF